MRDYLFLIVLLSYFAASSQQGNGRTEGNSSKPQNATEGEDEQDSFQDPLEEFPGPFMIKKLSYRLVEDESEPDYFGMLGVSRSSSLAKIRQTFRETSRKYSDLLMHFKSPPNLSRINLTNSSKRDAVKEKSANAKSARTRTLPLQHIRPPKNRTNETNPPEVNETLAREIAARAAAEEIAAKKKEAEKTRRWNDFMSYSEAYRILTDPRSS